MKTPKGPERHFLAIQIRFEMYGDQATALVHHLYKSSTLPPYNVSYSSSLKNCWSIDPLSLFFL